MNRIAVVPGSFDPVTLGHLDVIERATGLFDQVHVLVVHNPDKSAFLPVSQRVSLIERALDEAGVGSGAGPARIPRGTVVVAEWSRGLLVDYCIEVGASALVKGIRSQLDVAYETPMAVVNRDLARIETVFLLTDPAHALVSSSLVRQVAALGGDIGPYVPPAVSAFLAET